MIADPIPIFIHKGSFEVWVSTVWDAVAVGVADLPIASADISAAPPDSISSSVPSGWGKVASNALAGCFQHIRPVKTTIQTMASLPVLGGNAERRNQQ